MNCYNHNNIAAVAQCPDCGVALCAKCVALFTMPICASCKKKRISSEILEITQGLLLTFAVGILFAILLFRWTNEGHSFPLLFKIISFVIPFYVFSGLVPGWKTLTMLTPRVFLILPILGWIIYFIIKFLLSLCIGVFVFPIYIIKDSIRLVILRNRKHGL